jgi:hypothetical protein
VGTDTTAQQEALLQYLQEVFKLDDEKHNALLEQVKAKEVSGHLLLLHKGGIPEKTSHFVGLTERTSHFAGRHSFRNTPYMSG